MIKPAKPSSTLLLLRDRSVEQKTFVEMLLLKRSKQSRFLPGSLVFPGGGMEEGDHKIVEINFHFDQISHFTQNWLQWGFTNQDIAKASLGTALRECEEESGIKITRDMVNSTSIACIAHWLTPTALPKRFDTYFWGAVIENFNLKPQADQVEIESLGWWTAPQALQAYEKGVIDLPVPTLMLISEIDSILMNEEIAGNAQDILKQLATTPHRTPIQPILHKEDGITLYLPGDSQYRIKALNGEIEAEIERQFWQKQETHHLRQYSKQIGHKTNEGSVKKRWKRISG